MAERITVSGFRKPRSRPIRPRPARVPLVRPRDLTWLVVLASLPVVAATWGTPYVLISYTTTGPSFARTAIDCRYAGRDTRTVFPRDGRCPWLRLLKADNRN